MNIYIGIYSKIYKPHACTFTHINTHNIHNYRPTVTIHLHTTYAFNTRHIMSHTIHIPNTHNTYSHIDNKYIHMF